MAGIDINTRFICLVGQPLGQSFAARMQNAGYMSGNLNMRYFYNEAGPEHLEQIVDGIRYMPAFAGAAITKPNKSEVLQYLDDLDPDCEKMGACNTVVKDASGRLVGYNTDGYGFIETMKRDAELELSGKTYFCIGAGGVGRPICAELANEGASKIYITDLFEEGARELVRCINEKFAPVAEFVPYGEYDAISQCDVVINASGVGMGKTQGMSPVPADIARPGQFFFDACYNPRRTQFLVDAEAQGARVMNGLYMSLYQGCRQIELWTGRPAPEAAMRTELEAIITMKRRK